MNHPDDVDAAGDLTVEDQVAPDRKIAEIGTDVRAGRTKAWMLGKQMAFRIDLIENAVGRRRIVLGDIDPEFDEVLFAAFRPGKAGHPSGLTSSRPAPLGDGGGLRP